MPLIDSRGRVINDGSMLHNGQGFGVGASLLGPQNRPSRLDPGFWQPYLDSRGRTCVELRTGNIEVNNEGRHIPETRVEFVHHLRARGIDNPVWNTATLRKDQWIQMQQRVVHATRQRLSAWADLSAMSTVGGFNAWAKTTYEYQAMNDPGEAVKSMDGVDPGRTDRPLFNLISVPLPVTHSDFYFTDRELEVAAAGGTPLDTTMAEAAGRRIGELVEQTLIGTATGVTFGPSAASDTRYTSTTSTEYGYTNFPYRVTKTNLATPVTTAPETTVGNVLDMIETMNLNGFFGPYVLYHSTGFSRFLNDDYFRSGGTAVTRTWRERLMSIEGISAIRRLDYLTSGYQMILVQMDSEYMQAINGMDVTVMRWESLGGLRHNFKVLCIAVPLLKSPYNGVAPIIHATTS